MFDHVTIRVSDGDASERFYETVLETLGIEKDYGSEHVAEWRDFSLSPATAEKPVTRGLHIGFCAPTRAYVDEFWRVGTEAGYRDDGAPGPRPQYSESYYGSFLLDPDGNSAEAVHHDAIRGEGWIDHVWMRVADVAASKRFYELVAPHGGFQLRRARPDRAQFVGVGGSFSVVVGDQATENVHLAFPNGSNSGVEVFHRALVEAGYRSNGEPGERPIYHEGYFGAFVLDPDGNNVEVVNQPLARAEGASGHAGGRHGEPRHERDGGDVLDRADAVLRRDLRRERHGTGRQYGRDGERHELHGTSVALLRLRVDPA